MSLQSEYDAWHQRVYRAGPDHDDASSPWYRLVREHMGAVEGLRILEAACGRGGFVKELTQAGAHVTGCDFSSAALHAASAKLCAASGRPLAGLIQGNAQSLPFASDSFDVVVSCETIEHLPQPEAAVQEMYRVTMPGRNPVRWETLETNRAMRKLLSPFALSYFVLAEKARLV